MSPSRDRRSRSDRRQSPRVPTDLSLRFSLMGETVTDDTQAFSGSVTDMSNGGMQFSSNEHLAAGTRILFSVLSQEDQPVISGSAVILDAETENGQTSTRARFIEVVLHKAA